MRSFKTFSMVFLVNSFLSAIGVFTILGPVFGFPFILLYTFCILFLGSKSVIKNISYSFLYVFLIFVTSYNGFPLLAVGIMAHIPGIIAGVVVSSYLISKESK